MVEINNDVNFKTFAREFLLHGMHFKMVGFVCQISYKRDVMNTLYEQGGNKLASS